MKIDMKTPSIFIRAVSIFLVLTFIVGQVSAGQIVSTRSSDTLAASLVTDSNINPARSKPLQDDIAEKAEPGAIGNGAPLLELAQGKLPPRIILQGRELVVTASKLREAISVAMRLSIANKGKVPAQHQARFKKALDNLVDFQNKLEKRAYLYSADVRTPEDYLVGFSFKENVGLSLELIDRLYAISSTRLAQYIFHECVPEEGIIAERDDHRTIYNEIQSAIFDKYEVVALKQDLRGFIDGKSYAAAAEALSYIAVKNPDPIQASTIQASTIQILGDTLNKIDLDRTIQAINGVLETQGLDGSIYALAAKAKAILTTQGLDSGVYRAAIYEFIKAIETNPKIF
ncbi:MAG: hypothetical protein NTY47_06045, partial [Candidatus Omnitrophica bacterium]|nr:hypothetical protein [Candidatus Omnitrophota bacterium]